MADWLDGVKIDLNISGSVKIDVTIDNDLFKSLPGDVQKLIIRRFGYAKTKENDPGRSSERP